MKTLKFLMVLLSGFFLLPLAGAFAQTSAVVSLVVPPGLWAAILPALTSLLTMPLTEVFKWLGGKVPFFPALSGNATLVANFFLNAVATGVLPLLAGAYGAMGLPAELLAVGAAIASALLDKGFWLLFFQKPEMITGSLVGGLYSGADASGSSQAIDPSEEQK